MFKEKKTQPVENLHLRMRFRLYIEISISLHFLYGVKTSVTLERHAMTEFNHLNPIYLAGQSPQGRHS